MTLTRGPREQRLEVSSCPPNDARFARNEIADRDVLRCRPAQAIGRTHDIQRGRQRICDECALVPHRDRPVEGGRPAGARIEVVSDASAANHEVPFRACARGNRSGPKPEAERLFLTHVRVRE